MKKVLFTSLSVVLAAFIFLTNAAVAGNLVIKGSTTVLPIAQKVSEVYMKQHPDIKISISGGGSGNGMKALVDGSTDIADSSRFIKDKEVKLAVEKGRYPVPFAVAYDCIVPVVHPSNSILNLTMAQLKALYKGEIKNWKDLDISSSTKYRNDDLTNREIRILLSMAYKRFYLRPGFWLQSLKRLVSNPRQVKNYVYGGLAVKDLM